MPNYSICMFVHSLRSDWNNGNAHFLRGLARGLVSLGHDVRTYEPQNGWSYENLLTEQKGAASLEQFAISYPELDVRLYAPDQEMVKQLADELLHADIVIVHEWCEPQVVAAVLELRDALGFKALFLDTHHRASSSPQEIERLQIRRFDGILAFGEALRRIYRDRLGMSRAWTLHEAADISRFHPLHRAKTTDCVWIGNWGDEERTRELHEYLIEPARALHLPNFEVYGVRYPEQAQRDLASAGIAYKGYLPNLSAACVYAHSMLTLHIPRQQYAEALAGIPTIRVFEALACGIPLVCSPWQDTEKLFDPHTFMMARNGKEMAAMISELLADSSAREQLAQAGLECILQRHTCAHRAEQLTEICEEVLA